MGLVLGKVDRNDSLCMKKMKSQLFFSWYWSTHIFYVVGTGALGAITL